MTRSFKCVGKYQQEDGLPTARLLEDVLPMEEPLNAFTIRQHVFALAERLEQAFGEEQVSFIAGCQRGRNHMTNAWLSCEPSTPN